MARAVETVRASRRRRGRRWPAVAIGIGGDAISDGIASKAAVGRWVTAGSVHGRAAGRHRCARNPKSFHIKGTLCDQTYDNRRGLYVSELLRTGPTAGKEDVDMGNHPPITPCRQTRAGELNGDQARVYNLVAQYFIVSVGNATVRGSTAVVFFIDELREKENFTIRGKQVSWWRSRIAVPVF